MRIFLSPWKCSLKNGTVLRPTDDLGAPVQPVTLKVFSTWSPLHSSVRPELRHWFNRRAMVAPTPWRRFNRCYCLFLFSAELTWSCFFLRALVLPSWLLWAVLSWIEQVCEISRAKLIWVKLLTREPFLIVRSQTKNYKTQTKSSVLHLLVTLEFWKVLNLENWVCGSFDHEFWGVFFHISYELNL